ncbi:MAG: hypothetical protein GXO39_05740 [Thermotogae bacterium]|nr:hypothetical protein [Thermotogota bacterium]
MRDARKGFVLPAALIVLLVLIVMGAMASKVIVTETRNIAASNEAIDALKAAESGVEEALVKLKNKAFSSFPASFNGTINGATYNVVVNQSGQLFSIVSTGVKGRSVRRIEVNGKFGGANFYPFAINGQFNIGTTGSHSPDWDEATMVVKTIDNGVKNWLEDHKFDVFPGFVPELPKAADLDVESMYPDEEDCDYGDYSSDVTISHVKGKDGLEDKNGDGTIVVCGTNIVVDDALNVNDLVLAAKEDIEINDEITDKGRKEAWELEIIAGDDLIFGDNAHSKVKYTGKTDDGYNVFIYAGDTIEKTGGAGALLEVKGRQNTDAISNAFIVTPGEIDVKAKLVHQTGKTDLQTNYIVWADKGVSAENIHVTGKGTKERNWAMIVADGDATFDKWQFMNNTNPSGLTYNEIKNYCDNGQSLGIPQFYRKLYCDLKTLIENSSSEIQIEGWRVY